MKKNYLEPNEKVVELSADARFLDNILSTETDETGGSDEEGDGETLVKIESIWDKIW